MRYRRRRHQVKVRNSRTTRRKVKRRYMSVKYPRRRA